MSKPPPEVSVPCRIGLPARRERSVTCDQTTVCLFSHRLVDLEVYAVRGRLKPRLWFGKRIFAPHLLVLLAERIGVETVASYLDSGDAERLGLEIDRGLGPVRHRPLSGNWMDLRLANWTRLPPSIESSSTAAPLEPPAKPAGPQVSQPYKSPSSNLKNVFGDEE